MFARPDSAGPGARFAPGLVALLALAALALPRADAAPAVAAAATEVVATQAALPEAIAGRTPEPHRPVHATTASRPIEALAFEPPADCDPDPEAEPPTRERIAPRGRHMERSPAAGAPDRSRRPRFVPLRI